MKAVVWRGDSQIVSHRLQLSQAPAAFQKFDQRIDGYIKVILGPQR
jgi:glutathione-independent formaldehyde dehydrogenase